MPARDTYRQFCPLAAGLDVVGDSSTLLVIRELLIDGGHRADITGRLPGLDPDEVSECLVQLADRHVVTEEAGRYRLTSLGERLREPLLELSRWGEMLRDQQR